LKADTNKILGLAGVGPKAMQNIDEALAALTFPEPVVVEAAPVEEAAEAVAVEEMPAVEEPVEAKKEPRKPAEKEEEGEGEFAKDGVSLDELFTLKPEIFQTTTGAEDDSADKKKGKKGKKKSVELEFDESLGQVVGRKKHKRGGEDLDAE
jgi:hypothetical protein